MFDIQVVDYIKKALKAGQTLEQIKSALTENGWSEEEINENILEAQKKDETKLDSSKTEPIANSLIEKKESVSPASEEIKEINKELISPASEKPEETKEIKKDVEEIKIEEPKIQSYESEPSYTAPIEEPKIQSNVGEINSEPKLEKRPEPVIEDRFAINSKPVEKPKINIPPEIDPKLDLKNASIPKSDYISPVETPKEELNPNQTIYTYQHQSRPKSADVKQGKAIKLLINFAIIVMFIGIGGAAFIYFDATSYIMNFINSVMVKVEPVITPETEIAGQTSSNFASYNLQKTNYTAKLPEYEISLSEITNLNNFETALGVSFSDNQKASLINNNFFITSNFDKFYGDATDYASRNDDWTGLYQTIGGSGNISQRRPENSVFITSDYLTHIYHKLLENEFSYIEELNLYPALTELSNSLLKSATSATSTSTLEKESYERLSAYFLVSSAILNNADTDYQTFKTNNFIEDSKVDTKAKVLELVKSLATENNISESVEKIAEQEIELIFNANNFSVSPLMGQFQANTLEDYTQYGPRSHYAKNVILRNYFRAMMWFGRMNFLLNSTELTRDSANIALLMKNNDLKNWEAVFEPTAFFVGQFDDLSIKDFNKAIKAVGFTKADESDEAIKKLQTELLTYSNPQIMSSVIISEDVLETSKEDLLNSTKGFRFMGQRFTPDAFIFSELTQGEEMPDVETGQRLPSTPTALMVSTLMGDVVSKDLLDTWISNNAKDSDKVLSKKMGELKTYFSKVSTSQWTSNIYWSWLYTIKSLFNSEGDKTGYPMFMKNEDWNKKQTQTFLGSWTELKHDTLLYAKQSYAEKGGGGDEEEAGPVSKGYVEPNIEFLDRLIALVNMTNEGLTKFNLLPELLQSRNASFVDVLNFYKKIAVAELQNTVISDDDFEKLRLSAYTLDYLLQAPDSQVQLESNARSALIADVHTDVVKNQILYEADGIPNYIYVAVKDVNGTRLTKGLVYSYYEFTNPVGNRLTDETWQKWNYSSTIKLLKMPDWNKSLVK
jgi:hypothetical protein